MGAGRILMMLPALCALLATAVCGAAPFAYVTNNASDSVSVIDVATNAVVTTIPVGGGPYGVAVHPGIGRVYVTNRDSNSVSVIDSATNMVIATVPVGSMPTGIAINPAGTRVFVVTSGSQALYVIDTATNTYFSPATQLGEDPIGIAVAPDGNRVYVTNNFDGTVSVIDAESREVVSTINTGQWPAGIAINAAGTHAYVIRQINKVVSVIDLATGTAMNTVTLAGNPANLAVNPAGTRVYVTDFGGTEVFVIDATTNTPLPSVTVGSNPFGVSFDPGGSHAYVANSGSNTVSVIDTGTTTVTATIPVGMEPMAFGTFIYLVGPATPDVTIASSQNPSAVGSTVTFTASVSGPSGTPTGTVNFLDGASSIPGCSAVALFAGSAACSTNSLTLGTHSISAAYSGNGAYNARTSSALSQTVANPSTPSITLGSTANPSTVGQYVTYTAVVSGSSGTPTGTIVFRDDGAIIDGCGGLVMTNGRASCTIGNQGLGAHSMTAVYSGNSLYSGITSSTLPQVVNPAKANTPSITLGSSVNPSTVGQYVELTAVVYGGAGTPTGTIVFLDNEEAISGCGGLAMTNGQATCTPGSLTQGTHSITTVYSGDGTYNGVTSSTLPQTVNPAKANTPSFTLGSSQNPSASGNVVTFTAVLSGPAGAPTGNVVFRDNGQMISGCGGLALTGGQVTCSPPLSTVGTHSITGIYLGDANYNGITSSVLPQTVQ